MARSTSHSERGERASVLIVAVGVLVALTLMAVTFATLTRLELAASRNMDEAMTARLVARAGLEYAVYILRVDKYGGDANPYSGTEATSEPWVSVMNDENHDSYWEEWMPGGGWFSKPDSRSLPSYGPGAYTGTGVPDPEDNDVDNDGESDPNYSRSASVGANHPDSYDSVWLDFPFDLPHGRRAQVAILIRDFGASRLNVNYTWNNDDWDSDPTDGAYAYRNGRYTTDAATVTSPGVAGLDPPVIMAIVRERHGSDKKPWNGVAAATHSARFLPLNPAFDDRPFSVLTAEELIMKSFTTYAESPLRSLFALGSGSLNADSAKFLTPWSFDTLWPPFRTGAGPLKHNVNTLTASALFGLKAAYSSWWDETAHGSDDEWAQIAANIVDYRDSANTITVYGSKYGLEPHPYITEVHYADTYKGTGIYKIELYNGFAVTTTAAFTLTASYYDTSSATMTPCPIGPGVRARTVTVSAIGPGEFHEAVFTGNAHDTGFCFKDFEAKLVGQFGAIVDRVVSGNIANTASTQTTSVNVQRKRYNVEHSTNWDTPVSVAQDTPAGANLSEATNTLLSINTNWEHDTIRRLVVANQEIYTLGQLGDLLKIGYDTSDPYTIDPDWRAACEDPDDEAKISSVFFDPVAAASVMEFFESLTTEKPRANDEDDDADGQADADDTGSQAGDIGGREIQIPGRLNINTAPAEVLSYLPAYWDPSAEEWKPLNDVEGQDLAAAIVAERTSTRGPFKGIGDLLRTGFDDVRDVLGDDSTDNDDDGKEDDDAEQALVFRNIANMITVRTNVFAIYVTARVIDEPSYLDYDTDGYDNDNDGTTDEDGEASQYAETRGFNHDNYDNDNNGETDEEGEADKFVNEIGRQKLIAVVDRSTDPITVRVFRWVEE